MKSFFAPCASATSADAFSTYPVLDTFEIDDGQYFVLRLTDVPDALPVADPEAGEAARQPSSALRLAPAELAAARYTEISRFEVRGQLCAVVRLEPAAPIAELGLVLTERELQIATLVALGKPNKQIASHLRISEWTVSTHLRRIFMKLGVDSRAAMVYRCAALIKQFQP
jgi:DNA-binding CsgD family transcriptional regulator